MEQNTLTEVTYEHLSLSPFELVNIRNVEIKKEINEHGVMHFSGPVPEEAKDNYIFDFNFGTVVKLTQLKDGDTKVLFSGVLQNLSVTMEGELYILTGSAVTHTYLMDINIKRRSFQDINETYYSMVKKITKEYSGADVSFAPYKDKAKGGFIIQYKETDWEFIKRMASLLNEGVYPFFDHDTPKYFFGKPDLDNQKVIDEYVFTVKKDLSDYKYLSSNYIEGVTSLDFITYDVETYILLDMGEKVTYRNINFYVKSVRSVMTDGVWRYFYKLSSKNGLKQKYYENAQLQGTAVFGHVLDIQRDMVKVHIHEIDNAQDIGTAYWFPYSAMYASDDGSGWYCMPEKGDDIRIEFPNTNDMDAFAVSSVSKYDPKTPDKKQDRMGDTEVRYIRNPQGMEVTLTPTQVIISANGAGIIVMDEVGNIMVYANEEIKIKSGKDIIVNAGESISIEAGQSITMQCGKAEIKMNSDGIVEFLGNEVYTN